MTFWESVTKNWKTTATGIITFLLGVPEIVTALHQWAAHQSVDWRNVAVSAAMAIGGLGLVAAKDSTTHSTVAEVQVSTAKVEQAALKQEADAILR
jgi:hypothetical protein